MMTIFRSVPHFGVPAELALEHADGARAAHVVGHQHVGVHPDIVAGLDRRFAGGARENLFSQRHKSCKVPDAPGKFNHGFAAIESASL